MAARILVVEDDATSQELVAYLLGKAGYHVHTASDGQEGLEVALRERPDLILMDVQMPVMDGLQMARALKSSGELRGVQLVAVTAVAMVGDREKILAAGLDSYITKPIVPEEFVGQVEELLEPHQRATRPAGPASTSPSPPATEAPVRRVPEGRRKRVLVVDDKDDNVRLARAILESAGYEVDAVSDTDAALARARSDPPDLILSDVHMAGGSGYDLVGAVRADAMLKSVRMVLISASTPRSPSSDRFAALGVSDFILRPIDPAELLARVDAAVRRESVG